MEIPNDYFPSPDLGSRKLCSTAVTKFPCSLQGTPDCRTLILEQTVPMSTLVVSRTVTGTAANVQALGQRSPFTQSACRRASNFRVAIVLSHLRVQALLQVGTIPAFY